jgi:hypothetical protein
MIYGFSEPPQGAEPSSALGSIVCDTAKVLILLAVVISAIFLCGTTSHLKKPGGYHLIEKHLWETHFPGP